METQLKNTDHPSPELVKRRRFMLALPLLILPFLTMAFWALGGGKSGSQQLTAAPVKGIDASLPQAQFKGEQQKDKMDLYQNAGRDTSTEKDGVSKSFIRAMGFDEANRARQDSLSKAKLNSSLAPSPGDQQAAKIEARLAEINRQISKPQPQQVSYSPQTDPDPGVKRLNAMMKTMNKGGEKDPEMVLLSSMLTKIQQIQHPELVKPKPKKPDADSAFRAIPATISGKQKVVNGGTVRLILTDSTKIKGYLMPKGQELFGACSVTNQRLLLDIKNIRIGKSIIPVNLTVYSLDGLPGIPAPEADFRGAAGTGANNAVENMQFMSMDQSLGAQAAAGGVQAAKGLFSKKVQKIKVKLQNGFPVLLKVNRY